MEEEWLPREEEGAVTVRLGKRMLDKQKQYMNIYMYVHYTNIKSR